MAGQQKTQVHLVANPKSGRGKGASLQPLAEKLCHEYGAELIPHIPDKPDQLPAMADSARTAAGQDNGIVIAAGGDGTLACVAQALSGTGIPMGAVAAGTFNFFARNYGISEDPETALRTALTGTVKPVNLGEVNGRVFIINSSFGLYSRLIRAREQHTRRFGRHRAVAIASTALTLLKGYNPLSLKIDVHSDKEEIESPMIFIGINALQLEDLSFDISDSIRENRMAIMVMKKVSRWDLLRLTVHGLMKQMENEESLVRISSDEITITPRRKKTEVVLDGERCWMEGPLNFRLRKHALNLICPE